jgi:RNA polymerase II subunit A small phosphatase-like protein
MHPETFETIPIKDLRKAVRRGYPLERILIVDDTREKVCRNYGNAIYVTEFVGSNTDEELPQLAKYLVHLRFEPNFRRIEKRGWRNKQIPNIHE